MLKKTITYEDYDGNTRTEDLHFFISKSELMDMELSTPGGFANKLERVSKAQDGAEIMKIFKEIILKSYGEKSDDGRSFVKKRNGINLSEAFEQTEAFNQLYTELLMDPDKASAFVNGIMPKDIMNEITRMNTLSNTKSLPSENKNGRCF